MHKYYAYSIIRDLYKILIREIEEDTTDAEISVYGLEILLKCPCYQNDLQIQ